MTTDVILLVDDFQDAVEMYAEWLTFKGYDVMTAFDGPSAIRQAYARRPDLILMDVRMPGMTGIEAARLLRKDAVFATVPVVALTAHALDEERQELLASGFDAVLSKPVLPGDLVQAIASLLAVYRRR